MRTALSTQQCIESISHNKCSKQIDMKHTALFIFLLLHLLNSSAGFVLPSRSHVIAAQGHLIRRLYSSATSPSRDVHQDTSGLMFKASTVYKSRDASMPKHRKHREEILRFFSTDEANFHLLAKGTHNVVKEVDDHEVSTQLDHWTSEAHYMNAKIPTTDDKLLSLSVTTPFLVFVLKVTAMLGVKILWHSYQITTSDDAHTEVKLPEYQFILLDQTFSAEGPPPLVFIFNQLTGINKTAKGTYKQPNHALFTVKATPSKDIKRVSFVSRMTAELNIRFPEILLKLLPVPKERIEKEGSHSLKRNMERDVPPGVDLFRNAYVDWLRALDA